MIDPLTVTDFGRSDAQLEEWLLFCVSVAGKNADQQAAKLERLLGGRAPFESVRRWVRDASLRRRLEASRLGKYGLLERSFGGLAGSGLDLRTCPWEALTRFPGIGIKTAKFFVLHSRAGQMHGVLDTHVLAWMAERQGAGSRGALRVPQSSPQDPARYRFWETVFFGMVAELRHAQGQSGALDWARFDLDLWKQRRGSA